MLAIRLARTGKKHQAYFRIVVSDSRRTPTGKFIEVLGNYDPHAKKFQIDKEKVERYLKNGAQPSDSVAKLLQREKIDLPNWVKVSEKKRAPKKAAQEKLDAAAKPAEKVAEAPAEDAASTEEAPAEETTEAEKAEAAPAEEAEAKEEVKDEEPKTEDVAETEEAK